MVKFGEEEEEVPEVDAEGLKNKIASMFMRMGGVVKRGNTR